MFKTEPEDQPRMPYIICNNEVDKNVVLCTFSSAIFHADLGGIIRHADKLQDVELSMLLNFAENLLLLENHVTRGIQC